MNGPGDTRTRTGAVLVVLLVAVALIGARYGAVKIGLNEIGSAMEKTLLGARDLTLNERIFMNLRLPRTLMCAVVGASLAVGGVLMQALFRNPIVEPGLVGTSSGAAFGAALCLMLGALFKIGGGEWMLPLAACAGGILSTLLAFGLSRSASTLGSSVTALLLAGIGINALFLGGVGFLSYIARDPQARSIVFWNLGTLSGASWRSVVVCGLTATLCITVAAGCSKHLNALMLGEEEAQCLGVNVRRLKLRVLSVNVLMVAVATAFVGVIGFVGLVVPHLLRMIHGPDNRWLIPHSALLGAIFLSGADLAARMLLHPAELPIGVVTSALGVPMFILLLRHGSYRF